jgi:hypothetical protein
VRIPHTVPDCERWKIDSIPVVSADSSFLGYEIEAHWNSLSVVLKPAEGVVMAQVVHLPEVLTVPAAERFLRGEHPEMLEDLKVSYLRSVGLLLQVCFLDAPASAVPAG